MRGKSWGIFSYCSISKSCLSIVEKWNCDSESTGFPVIPKSAQKVTFFVEIYHLKLCLTFVRAPCRWLSLGSFVHPNLINMCENQ